MVSSTLRLVHQHRLEPALQGRVLLDVLAVLVQRGGPDARSSPRASMGLSMLPASIAPSAAPAPTTVCSSSMNVTIWPSLSGDLLQHRLEALLELAAVLRAGHHGRQVQGDHPLVLQAVRDVAARRSAAASPSTMAVLPTPGSPIRTGLFLVRRAEDLDDAADLLVAADDGIELALPGQLREVAAVLLQRPGSFSSGFWSVTR